MSEALETRLGPLVLANPIVPASGTFGYGLEFTDFVDLSKLGAFCTKGLSLEPHAGNPPPRICETPAGMLNAIGLQNVGVKVFLEEKLPRLRELGATVIANVWGDAEDDYVSVVGALEGVEGYRRGRAQHLLPERREGRDALRQLARPPTASLVSRVRAATRRTLIVKLSPNAPDLVESARAARDAGADVLSLVNTFVGMAIDPDTARPRLSFGTGGLSGPAIRPLARPHGLTRSRKRAARHSAHGDRRNLGPLRRPRVSRGRSDPRSRSGRRTSATPGSRAARRRARGALPGAPRQRWRISSAARSARGAGRRGSGGGGMSPAPRGSASRSTSPTRDESPRRRRGVSPLASDG